MSERKYVTELLDKFLEVFRYYIVESLRREYGDDYINVIIYGPGYDKDMAESQSKLDKPFLIFNGF